MMTLGERMLQYRAKHNLSQRRLADLLGTNTTAIFRWESNKNKPHKANELRLLNKMKELEEKENA